MSYIYTKYRYMNEYDIHKALINEYVLQHKGDTSKLKRNASNDKKDIDVIKDNHKFLWNEDDTAETWEQQLAKRYYDKLFKEYCICDLSRYKENKVALRWRIEQEVVVGKGQFSCSNKKCTEEEGLRSWEVNFAYVEHNEKKNALVKIRLCEECSKKLNYHSKKKEIKRIKNKKQKSKTKKKHNNNSSSSNSDDKEELNSAVEETDENKTEEGGKVCAVDENPEAAWEHIEIPKEKTQEEEIDDYLADLLF